jgi:hypothetical protein
MPRRGRPRPADEVLPLLAMRQRVTDADAHRFYEAEAVHANWSRRDLERPSGKYPTSGPVSDGLRLWSVLRWRPIGRPLLGFSDFVHEHPSMVGRGEVGRAVRLGKSNVVQRA